MTTAGPGPWAAASATTFTVVDLLKAHNELAVFRWGEMVRDAVEVEVRASPYVLPAHVLALDVDAAAAFGLPAEPWRHVLVVCPPEHHEAVAALVAQIRSGRS